MGKRTFQRRGDRLRDTYEHLGETHILEMTGGPVSAFLVPSASETPDQELVSNEVDRLLLALDGGDLTAPMALVRFTGDPRVPPALLKAARNAKYPTLANVAQALELARVEGAAEVLEERFARLLSDSRTFEDAARSNVRAACLSSVARALLSLRPEMSEAADALVRLLRHPNSENRNTAAAAIAEALQFPLRENVMGLLEKELEELLTSEDAALFATIAPAMGRKAEDVVLSRCQTLVQSEDLRTRELGACVLRKLNGPRASEMLASHLPLESSLRLACSIANHLGEKAPEELRLALGRQALADDSPSLRVSGVELVASLPADLRRTMAKEALADEPDLFLQSRLEALAASSS